MGIALAVILAGLLGRAAVDKILALRAGPESVALWAQLQSIVDLVLGVTMAGVGQGLTVLVAQATTEAVQRQLMRAALTFGFAVSALVALVLALGSGPISAWVGSGAVTPGLVTVAAAAGCAAVVPGLLTAYWLGREQRDRILWLNIATMLAMAGAAYFALPHAIAQSVLAAQAAIGLVSSAALHAWLRRPGGVRGAGVEVTRLRRYMVAGLSIGILSPVAMLVVRSTLAGALSWDEAGIVQALWRSSEWITAIAAGMLWMVALPRFSATCRTERFIPELARVACVTLSVSASLLLLLWFHQAAVLANLYDTRFAIPDRAAALFLFGDWLRIGSWVFLYALFAMQRTVPIAVGEVLSIPLYALLLVLNRDGFSLEWAGWLYCASYAAYFLFNAVAALRDSRRRSNDQPGSPSPST